jgi:hypothetical protein
MACNKVLIALWQGTQWHCNLIPHVSTVYLIRVHMIMRKFFEELFLTTLRMDARLHSRWGGLPVNHQKVLEVS